MHPNDYNCPFHGLFMSFYTQIIACCAYLCSYLRFSYPFRPRAETATFLFATMFLSDVSYMIVQCVSHHSGTLFDSFLCDTSLRIVQVSRVRCLTASHRKHSTSTMRRFTIGVNDLKGCRPLAYGWSRSLSLAYFATGRDGHERHRS